ncbi:hypothetical protein [Rhodopirellula sp. SWK7]|uniref:hypothetical protein n=1 Tax=Rhodopirellula sp. SWK7 TaxID=595460 RepID=UPI0002BF73E1|nr:hypothetical protein [Rhodopirellula sp. SWK7]EMI41547.1 hypothetical protein RRSWK_05963 [Rhodopirellula sp. SWK7]
MTPTPMVFVDDKLQRLLRGDGLRAFLDRRRFGDNEAQPDNADLNPWGNRKRSERGPHPRPHRRQKTLCMVLLAKWLAFGARSVAIILPGLIDLANRPGDITP